MLDLDFFTQKVLFEGDSDYAHILVTEYNGKRILAFGPSGEEHETACNLLDPDEPLFEYPCLLSTALALKPDSTDILLIGLGGGYLPAIFQRHRPDIRLTVVELDPLVVRLAEDFFYFSSGGSVEVIVAEGRDFLQKTTRRYDQIWVDAYDGTYIPAPLTTIEFLDLCRDRLKTHGVLAQNVHAENPLYMAHQATFTEAFDYFYLVRGTRGGNAALLGQKDSPQPLSIKHAFFRGLKPRQGRFGAINLAAETAKATLTSHRDMWAILTDEP